jgi:hypothetical protein
MIASPRSSIAACQVGIEQMDREHRQLFAIAARVQAGLGAAGAPARNSMPADAAPQ